MQIESYGGGVLRTIAREEGKKPVIKKKPFPPSRSHSDMEQLLLLFASEVFPTVSQDHVMFAKVMHFMSSYEKSYVIT